MTPAPKLLLTVVALLFCWSFSFAQQAGKKNQPAAKKDSIPVVVQNDFITRLTRRPDSLYFDSKADLEEQLKQLDFVSGYIYFSGTGFPGGVQAASVLGSIEAARDLLNRCGPGSRITLEKCVFRKKDQAKTLPISKSLFIRK